MLDLSADKPDGARSRAAEPGFALLSLAAVNGQNTDQIGVSVSIGLLAIDCGSEAWLLALTSGRGCLTCFRNWLLGGDAHSPDLAGSGPGIATCPLRDSLIASGIAVLAETQAADPALAWPAVRLDLDQATVTRHSYVRHPDCPACRFAGSSAPSLLPPPEAAQRAAKGQRGADLADLADGLRAPLLDPRLGLVRGMFRPAISRFQSLTIAPLYPFATPSFTESGYGRSGDPARDGDIALFEAIERFAAMEPRGRVPAIRASHASLGEAALDPASLIPHVDEAFVGGAMEPFAASKDYDWIGAYSSRQKRQVLIPQQIAYYGQYGRSLTGGRFMHETSSGTAIGGSITEAMLYGLMEAVERDAILVNWYGHRSCPKIAPETIADGLLAPMLARLEAEGLELVIQSAAVDLPVHTFLVRLVNRTAADERAFYLAAGAHLDPVKAVQGAIDEAISMVRRTPADLARENLERGHFLLEHPDEVRTLTDHETLSWPHQATEKMAFAAPEGCLTWPAYLQAFRASWGPEQSNLHNLIQAVLTLGGDVIFADLGYDELRAAGLHCVKAICTGLLPMTFGHRNRRIDWSRVSRHSPYTQTQLQSSGWLRPHTFP